MSCVEILVVSVSILFQNAAKEWEILGHWKFNLWAAELGLSSSSVYVKISFASLNILAV